jgi:arylsulfatase
VFDIPVAEQLKLYDAWGSAETNPHMAVGWAWAFDTPFKWTKQVASHFGGTRQGLVISWPARIKDAGGLRSQFHHVIDIVPTILEVTGIRAPELVNGIKQKPIEGVSMAYTFDKANANAASTRKTQYFELICNRASTMRVGTLARRRRYRLGNSIPRCPRLSNTSGSCTILRTTTPKPTTLQPRSPAS